MIRGGVKSGADIGALASRKERSMSVMVWHYHDDDVPAAPADIALTIAGLGAERVLAHHQPGAIPAIGTRRSARSSRSAGMAERCEWQGRDAVPAPSARSIAYSVELVEGRACPPLEIGQLVSVLTVPPAVLPASPLSAGFCARVREAC